MPFKEVTPSSPSKQASKQAIKQASNHASKYAHILATPQNRTNENCAWSPN
jgi:hypothetical protein